MQGVDMTGQWLVSLCIGAILSLFGLVFANVFNLSSIGKVLSVLAIFILVVESACLGAIAMTNALEAEIEKIYDGKNDVIITLKVGCFTYRRIVPTKILEGKATGCVE